ncbi:MAG TPA: HAD-IB family hydrolase [Kofleriaceae bacterium]|jgi:HAD superfamily hydrolase (TIGR01490 family)
MAGTVAFFDLDRTLIDANSGLLWAQHERRHGHISRGQMARAVFWTALYHLAAIDMETAVSRALEHYRGVDAGDLDRRTRAWFEREVARRLRPRAAEAMAEHRRRGDLLVILTNSSSYEARAATERWGFDDFLANSFPTDTSGRLTGAFERPLCYGRGKVTRAEAWASQRGIDLRGSTFYSDSYSDLPMLERVGRPQVVRPDPRLRLAARRRGWRILDW